MGTWSFERYIHITVEEQVALFLHIVDHHAKNRAMKNDFVRLGATVSKYFSDVLLAICSIRDLYVKESNTSIHLDIEFNPNYFSFFKVLYISFPFESSWKNSYTLSGQAN